MEILIGLAGLILAMVGLSSRTDARLTEIRDALIDIRDEFR